jgi:hypothetical protein
MSRRFLLAGLLLLVVLATLLFRKIGLGELAVIAAIFALAFSIESIRFVVGRFLKGYKNRP